MVHLFFNYQSSLIDEGGNAIQDGTTNIKFRIIDSAGTILYEEQQDLEVVNGQVSAIIGNGLGLNGAPTGGIPADIFDPTDTRYLQVEVAGYKPYDPMEIVTVPYALWADTALKMPDGAITSAMIGKGVITKEHLNAELTSAIFPSGIPKSLLPSDTVYTGDFESFRNTIQSSAGATKVGTNSAFIYSGSQTVQGVLTDLDLAIRRRREEINLTATAGANTIAAHAAETSTHGVSGNIVGTTDLQTLSNKTYQGSLDSTIGNHSGTVENIDISDFQASFDNHADTTSTHRVTGSIVGTTDTQTLENKTLTAPALTSPTITGTVTLSGTNLEKMLVPVGTIIPFYDFDGEFTFDHNYWRYCDGSDYDFGGSVGVKTLPDLSNRYLVGFGTEAGGDIDTAAWATVAVGNASHQVDLSHTHAVDPPNTTSGTESAMHTHIWGRFIEADDATDSFIYGGPASLGLVNYSWAVSEEIGGLNWAFMGLSWYSGPTLGGYEYRVFSTASESATHTHDINIGSFNSGSAGSTTQSIQPRSIRVRYIMRIK